MPVAAENLPQILEGFARKAVFLEHLKRQHKLIIFHRKGIAVLARGNLLRGDAPPQQGGKHLVGLLLGQPRVHLYLAAGKERGKRQKQQKTDGEGTQHGYLCKN